jgi:hypothetical protein
MWMKATFDHEAGRPVISKKFKTVAEMVLHRLDAEIKAGTARPSTKDYVSAIRLYLIPFYGAYNIDGIKPAVVSEFHTWRSVKVGRELSGSAQNNHNAALNLKAVWEWWLSVRERPPYLTPPPEPTAPGVGGPAPSRRKGSRGTKAGASARPGGPAAGASTAPGLPPTPPATQAGPSPTVADAPALAAPTARSGPPCGAVWATRQAAPHHQEVGERLQAPSGRWAAGPRV